MTVRTNSPCPLHGVYGLEYHVLVFCLTLLERMGHRLDWGYVSSLVSDRSAITLCDDEAGQPALMLVDKIK